MPGQGVIVGVGAHRLPGRVPGRRPARRSPTSACRRSSRSPRPTTTASSRAPSRACSSSGSTSCCSASDGFYDDVFRSPRRALRGGAVARATSTRSTASRRMLEKQMQVAHAHPRAPGARPPHRRPRPAGVEGAAHARRARPGHLRPHDLGPRPRVPHRRASAAPSSMTLGEILARAARRLLPHDRHRVHAHPGHRASSAGSRSRSRASHAELEPEEQRHILDRLNAAEAFEKFLATKYVGQKRFGLEGAESAIPILDAILERGGRRRPRLGA